MRGQVLHFDPQSGTGTISGSDGQRYSFSASDLMGGTTYVSGGANVDFEGEAGQARSVYLVPSVLGEKNKWIAAILTFFFGWFGVHKFYLGKTNAGIIMLISGTIGWLLVLPGLAVALISFIELIIYLVKSEQDFYNDYVAGNRSWF